MYIRENFPMLYDYFHLFKSPRIRRFDVLFARPNGLG